MFILVLKNIVILLYAWMCALESRNSLLLSFDGKHENFYSCMLYCFVLSSVCDVAGQVGISLIINMLQLMCISKCC
ncbi:unnamed protein product [Larinioides sclopetarius]|uniref:Uncharacterized protein n=1 Tax=Larinioides sclopetarius TaxID=280406 RepID=A0AAV2BF90_9ARAC